MNQKLKMNSDSPSMSAQLRAPAEIRFAVELDALRRLDTHVKPPQWELSPRAVLTYIMGGVLSDGTEITPKFIGAQSLIEVAIATLTTDRALLLMGVPGTGKSWVAEHLAAAVSGDSTLIVQGTAGCGEESIRYGWNYAELLSHGPSESALVESPVLSAMRHGKIARVEELTRLPQAVQDALITALSEKMMPIPELNSTAFAVHGFGLIATANSHDQGVNTLSSALRRRFNVVRLPTPATLEEELRVVQLNTRAVSASALDISEEVVKIFRDLRGLGESFADDTHTQTSQAWSRGGAWGGGGRSQQPQVKTQSAGSHGHLSPADAIAVVDQVSALSLYFRDVSQVERALAEALYDAVVKTPQSDVGSWTSYVKRRLAQRSTWESIGQACLDVIKERAA